MQVKNDFDKLVDYLQDMIKINRFCLLEGREKEEIDFDMKLIKEARELNAEKTITKLIQRWIDVLGLQETLYFKENCMNWKNTFKTKRKDWNRFKKINEEKIKNIRECWLNNIKNGRNQL